MAELTNLGTQYLAIFRLADHSHERLGKVVPRIQDALERMSNGSVEIALRSVNGDIFGYFLRFRLNSKQIKVNIESPAKSTARYSFNQNDIPMLSGNDSVMVLSLGEDFVAGKGFTRAGTWLQRH